MIDRISPVLLKSADHDPIWSGERLSLMYSQFKDSGKIGEAWLTSAEAPSESCAVIDGFTVPFSEYLRMTGNSTPPLVKIIDAGESLSVQVHPDEISAMKLGGISKSELWFILAADPGASILYGTADGVTAEDVRKGIFSGEILQLLCRIPVKQGEVYMIPPGMIHALGGGITVLEVQNRAGTTYRVKDIAGNRETHPDESADSFRIYSPESASAMAFTDHHKLTERPLPGEVLASTHGFAVTRYVSYNSSETLTVHGGTFMFCEYGSGHSGDVSFTSGDSLFFGSNSSIALENGASVFFVI